MSKPLVLAFDPSTDVTGYALVRGPDLLDAGALRPKGDTLYAACRWLVDHAQAVIDNMARGAEGLEAVVVEFPQVVTYGKAARRSAATLPNYGVAVGALAYGLRIPAGCRVMTPSATEWTRGYPPTRDDRHKLARVRYAESIYGLAEGALGAKTVAGNVADAALLAHWAVSRLVLEARMGA